MPPQSQRNSSKDWVSGSNNDFLTVSPKNPEDPLGLTDTSRKVLVVGAGLAGLSTALELAKRGYSVTIKEKDNFVGGRVHSKKVLILDRFFNINHGFHAWFHNYFNLNEYLDELGVRKNFVDWGAVSYRFPEYADESIQSTSFFPANVLKIIRNSPNLTFKELFNYPRFLRAMNKDFCLYDFEHALSCYDDMSVSEYCLENNIPQDFFDILLFPALSATLNEPKSFSAAEFLMYNQIYFMNNPRSDKRLIAKKPYNAALFDAWKALLGKLKVRLELNSSLKALLIENSSESEVSFSDASSPSEKFDYVVLACGLSGFKDVIEGSKQCNRDPNVNEKLEEVEIQICSTQSLAPPYKIFRVWFNETLKLEGPSILETPGYDQVNLIAMCHELEDESFVWANETGGAIIEFHSYTWPKDMMNVTDEEAWSMIQPTVCEILPELENLEPIAIHVNSYWNFPSFSKGTNAAKPLSDSLVNMGLPNIFIAGDWVQTKYPAALMERAVLTGKQCANHILLKDSVRQLPLKVLPKHGPGFFKL